MPCQCASQLAYCPGWRAGRLLAHVHRQEVLLLQACLVPPSRLQASAAGAAASRRSPLTTCAGTQPLRTCQTGTQPERPGVAVGHGAANPPSDVQHALQPAKKTRSTSSGSAEVWVHPARVAPKWARGCRMQPVTAPSGLGSTTSRGCVSQSGQLLPSRKHSCLPAACIVRPNTHRGARAQDHKVKSLALCRLS